MKAIALVLLLTGCQLTPEQVRLGRCAELKQTAAVSQRAAQICTADLVGCSLSFEQIKQTLAEQEAAKGCP